MQVYKKLEDGLKNLFISNHKICIKTVEMNQLSKLLEWYNMTEDYSYATGQDVPVSLDELWNTYFSALTSEKDFFLGIHTLEEDRLVGMFKCRLSDKILWIYSLIIDRAYQGKGLGTLALNLLLEYLKMTRKCGEVLLSVVEDNPKGRQFWMKNGFREIPPAARKTRINGRESTIIIMKKEL